MEVREEVRQLAGPLSEEEGFELVDVEFVFQGRRKVIRVLLDRPGGITVGECGRFSRRLADCLDMNQTIPGSYSLEVSSPGIDRPVRTLESVARFSGKDAALVLHEPRDGRRNFAGTLLGPEGDRVGLRDTSGVEHWFDWSLVRSVRLVVDPWAESKRRTNVPVVRPEGGADGRRRGGAV